MARGGGISQNLAHLVLRTAKADAIGSLNDRTIDQHWMGEHCIQNLIVADVRAGEAELLRQWLLGAQSVAWAHARAGVKTNQLLTSRRRLQIFANPQVATRVAPDLAGW